MCRTLFSSLMGLIDAPLLTVMDRGIANAIAYVGTRMVYLLALVMVSFGLALAAGLTQMPARNAVVTCAKIALAVAFTSQTTYTYYVRDLINVAMPHDSANWSAARHPRPHTLSTCSGTRLRTASERLQ